MRGACVSCGIEVLQLYKNSNETDTNVANEQECDVIEGIHKVPNPDLVDDAVTFGNEAAVCSEAPGDSSYYNLGQKADDDYIKKTLARPVLIGSGSFGVAPGTVSTFAFDASSLRSTMGTANWDRMIGYVGVRATLKFSVVVSKTAFNQGIVSMCFQHGVGNDNKFRARNVSFPLSVHLPSARLNLADQSMMELSVPFVYAEEYLRVRSGLGTDNFVYGTFALVNLTGCNVAAGQSTPRYSIYMSMHDIEFIGAQPFDVTSVVTQAGEINAAIDAGAKALIKKVSPKAGKILKEAKEKKVVSSTLKTASTVARYVSYVPGLNVVGGAADWFLRGTAKVAEALGYSKPLDEMKPQRVSRNTYAGEGQTDLPNIGYALAPFQSNKLAIDGTIGCVDEDQMAFDYVLTKYSYIYRGTLTTSQTTGDTVYSSPVTPSAFWYRDRDLSVVGATGNIALKSSNVVSENAMLPSTLCWIGDNFRYWRGNLKFKVSFAKTKMHGGRVLFSFIPYRDVNTPAAPISNTRRVPLTGANGPVLTGHSLVFDLQDANEFEFEVPFIYPEAYCPVLSGSIGDVSMVIVNPLTSLSSIPTNVFFMVEVCAMPSFEFASPCPSLMVGVPPTGTVAVTYQSGMEYPIEVDPSASQQCIGEVIQSVKTIIQMPDYYIDNIGANTITNVALDPWFKPNDPPLATPMATTTQTLFFGARSSRMADLYSFARGATSYIIHKDRTGAVTHSFKYEGDDAGATPATNGSYYDRGLSPNGAVTIGEALESSRVVIPTYAKVARIPTEVRVSAFGGFRSSPTNPALITYNGAVSLALPKLVLRNNTASSARYMVGRAAADDALLSQFIGPPPAVVLNVLATVNPVFGSGIGAEW